jgi:hypothetical protein
VGVIGVVADNVFVVIALPQSALFHSTAFRQIDMRAFFVQGVKISDPCGISAQPYGTAMAYAGTVSVDI